MIQDYLAVAIFVSFPEVLLMLLIGFNLCNIRNIKGSKLLIVAAIQAVVAFLIRMSNIYFGMHTIILTISLYILVVIFFKIKYYKAIIPVFIGMLSQGLLQGIIFGIIEAIWNFEMTNLYFTHSKLIICSIPIFIVSLILLAVIRNTHFFLWDINELEGEEFAK
ncbi:hypothetical protein R9X47_23830 [Wukongibacter baidiensis]|uniref:hypothetical protein n=1 Tax=Wukongibacter baidiensis TaxID=1723361 RepID=UPI003D7F9B83